MNDGYEVFVEQNRQLLVDAARDKDISITMGDLHAITGPQIPLTMMADEFLDALKEGLFSIKILHEYILALENFILPILLNDQLQVTCSLTLCGLIGGLLRKQRTP